MNMEAEATGIRDNLALIKRRIQEACKMAGRPAAEVRLLLATKTVPAERIRLAVEMGERLLGENKVQELKEKDAVLAAMPVERHFIGHLQTNKIKEVLKYVDCIQSVDRPDLVEKLDARLQRAGRRMAVFAQVNTSFEESKFGAPPSEALQLIRKIGQYGTLQLKGLMTIGLFDADPEKVRPSFRLLRQLRAEAIGAGLLPVDAELSMGMSGDLETAIAEGATLVRVGTAIFGKRQYPDSYYWNENKTIQ